MGVWLGLCGGVCALCLCLLLTGQAGQFDAARLLVTISPHLWGVLGLFAASGLSVFGAGWGILLTGSTLIGASVRTPRTTMKNLISILFCEAVAIYGIIGGIILYLRLDAAMDAGHAAFHSGYALFWSGMVIGLCNLACGVCVGSIGASAALADAYDPALFVKALIIEIFASIVGIFGLLAGLLMGP